MSYYIELPCKIGDIVYMINLCNLVECKIIEINILQNDCVFIVKYADNNRTELHLKQLGKNWFVNLYKMKKGVNKDD